MLGPLEEVSAGSERAAESANATSCWSRCAAMASDCSSSSTRSWISRVWKPVARRRPISRQTWQAFTTEIASAFDSAMKNAGLRFSVECLPIADPVYVDRDMWEKIVLNLLSNAYKFTFEGEVALTLKSVDGAVELQVRDTGVGIPEEHRERRVRAVPSHRKHPGQDIRRHRDRTGAGSGTRETARRHCARGERRWRRQHIHRDDSERQGASARRAHSGRTIARLHHNSSRSLCRRAATVVGK